MYFTKGWNIVSDFGTETMAVNTIEYSQVPIVSDTEIRDISGTEQKNFLFPSIVNIAKVNKAGDYIFNNKTWQYEPYNCKNR